MCKKILPTLILFLFSSCGSRYLGPPEIDLLPYERIGLITFTVEKAKGELDEMSTQHFLEDITRAQRGVQIVELGKLDEVLDAIDMSSINPKAAQLIGEHFGVNSFFHGKVIVSDVKPKIDISAFLRSMRVYAYFDIFMSARLVSTDAGVVLWADSVEKKKTLAYLSLNRGSDPYFDLQDQRKAYTKLIRGLVHSLTRDFR